MRNKAIVVDKAKFADFAMDAITGYIDDPDAPNADFGPGEGFDGDGLGGDVDITVAATYAARALAMNGASAGAEAGGSPDAPVSFASDRPGFALSGATDQDGFAITEDPSPLPLDITPRGTDTPIQSVVLSNLPQGTQLSAGTPNANGTAWSFTGPPPLDLSIDLPDGSQDFVLQVEITDADGSALLTQSVMVADDGPENSAPMAGDDGVTTDEDTALRISAATLLANDTDADGDTLTIAAVDASGTTGIATLNADGSVTYDLGRPPIAGPGSMLVSGEHGDHPVHG